MHRACKFLPDDRLVDLAHQFRSPRRLHANDDAVRVKEITDCRSLPEKLGIRSDVILQLPGSVNCQMFAQLSASLDGDSALLDNKPVPFDMFRDGVSDAF